MCVALTAQAGDADPFASLDAYGAYIERALGPCAVLLSDGELAEARLLASEGATPRDAAAEVVRGWWESVGDLHVLCRAMLPEEIESREAVASLRPGTWRWIDWWDALPEDVRLRLGLGDDVWFSELPEASVAEWCAILPRSCQDAPGNLRMRMVVCAIRVRQYAADEDAARDGVLPVPWVDRLPKPAGTVTVSADNRRRLLSGLFADAAGLEVLLADGMDGVEPYVSEGEWPASGLFRALVLATSLECRPLGEHAVFLGVSGPSRLQRPRRTLCHDCASPAELRLTEEVGRRVADVASFPRKGYANASRLINAFGLRSVLLGRTYRWDELTEEQKRLVSGVRPVDNPKWFYLGLDIRALVIARARDAEGEGRLVASWIIL